MNKSAFIEIMARQGQPTLKLWHGIGGENEKDYLFDCLDVEFYYVIFCK